MQKMASSFRKKAASSKPSLPRGSRPSLHNAQLLVSSGVPSLDYLLGGGLAVGTVLLVEEDVFGSYSRVLLKCFLAEGAVCGHSVLVASASEHPQDIVKELPAAVEDETSSSRQPIAGSSSSNGTQRSTTVEDSMRHNIAWRYQNLPKVQSTYDSRFGHFFNMSSVMDQSRVDGVSKVFFDASKLSYSSPDDLYASLRAKISDAIHEGQFSVDTPQQQQRNILRIGLHSLGSPLWNEGGGASNGAIYGHSLPRFLHSLRALLRRAYGVAMVTVPTHLMQDASSAHVWRLEQLCDSVVRLESFAGSEDELSALYRDYHGLFHIIKLPRLNSLVCHMPETLDLAFKLRRKKFIIEKLHLPPELSETASRSQGTTRDAHLLATTASTSSKQRDGHAPLTTSSTSAIRKRLTNIDF